MMQHCFLLCTSTRKSASFPEFFPTRSGEPGSPNSAAFFAGVCTFCAGDCRASWPVSALRAASALRELSVFSESSRVFLASSRTLWDAVSSSTVHAFILAFSSAATHASLHVHSKQTPCGKRYGIRWEKGGDPVHGNYRWEPVWDPGIPCKAIIDGIWSGIRWGRKAGMQRLKEADRSQESADVTIDYERRAIARLICSSAV